MEQTIRVCTRCGEPASEHRFCPSCGLNLATMRQLPTRTEWEGWQERRLRQADEGEQSARVNHPDGAHSGQTGFGEQSYPHDLVWWRPAAEDFERPPVRQPPAGSQGRGQRAQSTNVLAVVSLAFGILWLYWLGSLIAVVTGHIARRQIRDSHNMEGGDVFAVVGLALGWVGLGVLLIILLAATGS